MGLEVDLGVESSVENMLAILSDYLLASQIMRRRATMIYLRRTRVWPEPREWRSLIIKLRINYDPAIR